MGSSAKITLGFITTALAIATGAHVLDLFMMLNDEYGISSVLVTHNMEIASRLNRRIRLSDGKIVNAN